MTSVIEIDDKLLSGELFERKFVCDLNACKGACCIEGDSGAPLELEEVSDLEEAYDEVKPYMRKEGVEAVEKEGVFYMDWDNEPVTTLVNGKECAFVTFDKNDIAKCSIEEAYNDGKIDFQKPISCHLYPIRVSKLAEHEALNYNEWNICEPACSCGSELDVKVFRFLKGPLIRKYGEEFYKKMEVTDKMLTEKQNS